MLCIPIFGSHFQEIARLINTASQRADLLEFRIDLFQNISVCQIKSLRAVARLPLLLTLRSVSQGGKFSGSAKEWGDRILEMADLEPEYLDIEYGLSITQRNKIIKKFPRSQFILSYHNFEGTPDDLDKMVACVPRFFRYCKMATWAHSTLDALRMLECARNASCIGMCMGPKGEITRSLGPSLGIPWIFAPLSEATKTAVGQLTCKELALYGRGSLYGLIGSVALSLGHYTHNHAMQKLGLDGVYVKMELEMSELHPFLNLTKRLGFKGLSVTMPLKEAIVPFLDEIDWQAKKIGAVNTLLFREGRIIGYNTDGIGALNALESAALVRGKKVVVLGAGGAARAIIYEALQRGSEVLILNRNEKKALQLAEEFGCWGGPLEKIRQEKPDFVINATSSLLPVAPKDIPPQSIVMDIHTRPKVTPFLHYAMERDCSVVHGFEMFVNQAVGQYGIWFPTADKNKVKHLFRQKTLEHLTALNDMDY